MVEIVNRSERAVLELKDFSVGDLPVAEAAESAEAERRADSMLRHLGNMVVDAIGSGGGLRGALAGRMATRLARHARDTALTPLLPRLPRHAGFFDPVTGQPTEGLDTLMELAPLFDGAPRGVRSNLLPLGGGPLPQPPGNVHAVVANAAGVYSALLASSQGWGGPARLMFPVPESDGTRYSVSIKTSERGAPRAAAGVSNDGVLEIDFDLAQWVLARIVAEGAKQPPGQRPPAELDPRRGASTVFRRDIAVVETTREDTAKVRTVARGPDGVATVDNGEVYSVAKVAATPGRIGGADNVVPWDRESALVDIRFPKGGRGEPGGVSFFVGAAPRNGDGTGFWVYPRSEAQRHKLLTLRLLFLGYGGAASIEVPRLPANRWSRVFIPAAKAPMPEHAYIRVVGDPAAPELVGGNKVSFEFNGFHYLADSRRDMGASGMVAWRTAESAAPDGGRFLDIVLLLRKGRYFEYRHAFDRPVEILGVSELSARGRWEMGGRAMVARPVYKPESQLLVISPERLPRTPSAAEVAAAIGMAPPPESGGMDGGDGESSDAAAALAALTPAERERVEREGLAPLVFRVHLAR